MNAITIITKDFLASDLQYSQIVAKHIGIPLELKYVNIDEILSAVENTIKILKILMTLRSEIQLFHIFI